MFIEGKHYRKFLDMPCKERVYRDKKRRSTGQLPGRHNVCEPVLKRGCTGCQPQVNHFLVLPSDNIGFRFVCFWKNVERTYFRSLENTVDFCFLGKVFHWHPILPDPPDAPMRPARDM